MSRPAPRLPKAAGDIKQSQNRLCFDLVQPYFSSAGVGKANGYSIEGHGIFSIGVTYKRLQAWVLVVGPRLGFVAALDCIAWCPVVDLDGVT
ncbi:hypothetical protein N7466_000909 [Penicillium verhagenii]|uniref:uncharacterized protein n=1 Tax=Penicillium verhagenii TaxID=1562060 RepID=UPI00254561D9|nr:uncharacterized protein N7466_000909 [Penicillium verhagenii]KAJ5947894.1 hypothetical protein N7466_000909 [Penicillium verhagenii]